MNCSQAPQQVVQALQELIHKHHGNESVLGTIPRRPGSPDVENDKRVIVTNRAGRFFLNATSFVTKPAFMLTIINAINLAAYAVETFESPVGNKVMKIIKYGIPVAYAAGLGWVGAYKVSTLMNTALTTILISISPPPPPPPTPTRPKLPDLRRDMMSSKIKIRRMKILRRRILTPTLPMGGLFMFEDKLGFAAYEGTQQVIYLWFLLELHSSVNE